MKCIVLTSEFFTCNEYNILLSFQIEGQDNSLGNKSQYKCRQLLVPSMRTCMSHLPQLQIMASTSEVNQYKPRLIIRPGPLGGFHNPKLSDPSLNLFRTRTSSCFWLLPCFSRILWKAVWGQLFPLLWWLCPLTDDSNFLLSSPLVYKISVLKQKSCWLAVQSYMSF